MQQLLMRRIDARKWVLEQEFKSECGITVPSGFVTDGLSVPRLFHFIASPADCGFNAAVVHDYLLVEGHPWEYANERFKAQLELDKVSLWRITLYVAAVEIWAWYKTGKNNDK